jgi:aspartyl aminopeptidase
MIKKSSSNEKLKNKLFLKVKPGWDKLSPKDYKSLVSYCEEYKNFLNTAKTERECVKFIEKISSKNGFKNILKATKNDKKLFINHRGVASTLAVINDPSFKDGFNILAAHIDAPRIDLKPRPLYEAESMAYMKTIYYGGIKKYQWVTIPFAMHAHVVKKDGKCVDFVIGEKDDDPVFTVNDLLIHLAQNQMVKPATKVIEGEQINILVGSIPYKFKTEKNAVKLFILDYLNKKYGITEEDFISADIQLVPSQKAKDIGFDRSFIGSYAQDDRVCSFASLKAVLDAKKSKKNLLVVFFDKEEVGSTQDTGADSNLLIRIVNDILTTYGKNSHSSVVKILEKSKAISADVTAGVDPEWADVNDLRNAAKIGLGATVLKYGGGRGKSGASETHPEFIAEVRNIFNKNNVKWQTAELGKVDHGGGGTVAKHMAFFGMDVLDCGTALFSMHSPFEVASKLDIYNTYLAFKVFLEKIS